MNYDLAIMALEGLARAPLRVRVAGGEVLIEGQPSAFKDLARLCLLLGGDNVGGADEFELLSDVHVHGSPMRLRLMNE
jgi:hypothetical protein